MATEKREQVFVSSTYVDLLAERQVIIQTLLQADCLPAGMELFPASDDEKWDLIKRVIDDSDYYVVVIGGRYGSVDDDGLSFTEKEFDYADSIAKPIMAFLHGEPGAITADKTELDPDARAKLDAFRTKASKRMAKFWTTPDGLAGAVALSLIQTRKTHPAEGWVRASAAMTPEVEREMAELRATAAALEKALQEERESLSRREFDADLAQGDDEYQLPIIVRYYTQEDVDSGRNRPVFATGHFAYSPVTWDEIFADLGPSLLDEASETAMRRELSIFAYAVSMPDPPAPEDAVEIADVDAAAGALEDVKVQFFSLGLIEQSSRRHPVTDKNSYWTLTSEGRAHLMRLRALRKPSRVDAGEDGRHV
ncbi:DUF4062 domain-containing protein [Microbacterium oxydans]|uniref:DUF4062 domain-containing protein n=1 Tax=Microbacterium oxydans TaxID=82380 RepID=UPI000B828A50|nr:DUF4062 domain-containing protein [Microbacterium oxydans]